MKTAQDILALYNQRNTNQTALLATMRSVRDQYNGDVIIPLPEIDAAELPAVANILNMGLDQTAKRIASTVPDVFYPSINPGQARADGRARNRRRANLSWWEMNRMRLKLRRRTRYLVGYSNSPVVIRPDFKRRIPQWQIRNPLSAFPCPMADPDDITPPDCIFTYQRTYQWCVTAHEGRYQGAMAALYKGNDHPKPDDLYTILEYHDAEETVLVVVGKKRSPYESTPDYDSPGHAQAALLERAPNYLDGLCPVIMPATINLDRAMGLFDSTLGMYQTQAKLMAVAVQGAFLEILPETWAVNRAGENLEIITQPDPLRGITGEVKGGDIKHLTTQGSQTGMAMIDRLERVQRVEGGVPAEFGGESGSNIRTGRRGDAVMSATVDFTIQECQEILAASLEEENRRAIAIDRAYFGREKKSFWVNWDKAVGKLDYTPNDIFAESDRQIVRYSYAGADANNFIISAGQRVGIGSMSKRSFMEVDPLIPDADQEHDRIVQEALEAALLSSIQQGVADQTIPITDAARIMQLATVEDMPLLEAVQKAQEEAQERQSSEVAPVQPGAPEAQPGLSAPGAGAEAGTVPPPTSGMENLSMMLRDLRNSGRAPVEQPVPVS